MIGLTHNIVTSLLMSFCGPDEDCSMGGAVGALSRCDNRSELAIRFFHRQICGYLAAINCAEIVEFVHACIMAWVLKRNT